MFECAYVSIHHQVAEVLLLWSETLPKALCRVGESETSSRVSEVYTILNVSWL